MKQARDLPDFTGWTDEQIDEWLETHDVSELIDKAEKQPPPAARTSTGMPRISRETLAALFSRYSERQDAEGHPDWGRHIESVKQRLLSEDENAVRFIEFLVGKNFIKKEHDKAFACLIALYALLEHQVESERLHRNFAETGNSNETDQASRSILKP